MAPWCSYPGPAFSSVGSKARAFPGCAFSAVLR